MKCEVISVKEHHEGPLKHYIFLTKQCHVQPMLCTLFHKRKYACRVKILHGYMVVNLVVHLLFFLILSHYFYPYSLTSDSIHCFGSSSISYTLHVNINPNTIFPLLSTLLPWRSQLFLNLVNHMLYLSNPTQSLLNLSYPKVTYFPYFNILHVMFFIFHILFIFQ